MDPWEMFCQLVKEVVDSQSCYLEVTIIGGSMRMGLYPLEELEEGEGEE